MDTSNPVYKVEWFHGLIPREEVVHMLKQDGDFLVRQRNDISGNGQYVLSVQWSGPKHFIIQGDKKSGWKLEGALFTTIEEMINHLSCHGLPVSKSIPAVLKVAIARQRWAISNDDILLEDKIGSGHFGDVYKGQYKGKPVAIKTCKETLTQEQKKSFLKEGRILKEYNHLNIVRFIGIAVQRHPVMIIMEYVAGGSLLEYLKMEGKKKLIELSHNQMITICQGIASGMVYLEEHGCIHRDLAARNCLIGTNFVVKIADFGMSLHIHDYTLVVGHIPIRWTAPEAISNGIYSSASDVWSFAVVMWEVFSFGETPYAGLSKKEALSKILHGYRLLPPGNTPKHCYDLMLQCWQAYPDKRPTFIQIYRELQRLYHIV